MDLTIKNFALITAIALTGLSAGLFFAWSVSVIPGTKKVFDFTYLEAMQQINREILNPRFFFIFFGALVALTLSTALHFGNGTSFWLMLSATLIYLAGTLMVTGLGNVPLNNELDALNLNQLSAQKASAFRTYYETKWNAIHQIRSCFSVLTFLISLLTAFISNS